MDERLPGAGGSETRSAPLHLTGGRGRLPHETARRRHVLARHAGYRLLILGVRSLRNQVRPIALEYGDGPRPRSHPALNSSAIHQPMLQFGGGDRRGADKWLVVAVERRSV